MAEYTSLNEIFEFAGDEPIIGQGGFATVYRVCYKGQTEHYALKLFNFTAELRSRVMEDCQRELALLRQVQHPSVLRVIDYMIIAGQPAILMELVEGTTLWDLIEQRNERHQVFGASEVLALAEELAEALAACHRQGIVHNDLHPNNIIRLKASEDRPHHKLIDFGLSVVDNGSKREPIRTSIQHNGVPEFKAPEKWDWPSGHWGKLSPATDIYSYGVVLYTLLAGQPPYGWLQSTHSDAERYELMCHCCALGDDGRPLENIPALYKQRLKALGQTESAEPDYPYWLELLIQRCLNKEQSSRFADGSELLETLRRGLKGDLDRYAWPIEESTPVPPPPPAPSLWERLKAFFSEQGRAQGSSLDEGVNSSTLLRTLLKVLLLVLTLATFYMAYSLFSSRVSLTDGGDAPDQVQTQSSAVDGEASLRNYLEADLKALSTVEVEALAQRMSYPLSYYGTHLANQEDFIQHYMAGLRNVQSKSMKLESIESLEGGVYRVQRIFYVRKRQSRKAFVRDEYFLLDKDGRISSISHQPKR